MAEIYAHGHHSSVVSAHATRSAANSAAYLLEHVTDGVSILDVGCGPGTITADLAALTPTGSVLGIDGASVVIDEARSRASRLALSNLTFAVGNAYSIDAADDTFDIVTCHQLLHHLANPVDALREFKRVAKPGGIVAAREVDYAGVFWYPLIPALDDWLRIMLETGEKLNANFSAGRRISSWAHEVGFAEITVTSTPWTYTSPAQTAWWGNSWAERAVSSSYATQALELGLATTADLESIADAWLEWADTPGAFIQLPHGELIARV